MGFIASCGEVRRNLHGSYVCTFSCQNLIILKTRGLLPGQELLFSYLDF